MTKKLNNEQLWQRFQTYYREFPPIELALDISRMRFPGNFFKTMQPEMQQALEKMDKLEAGEIANPDENRQVGHYWLRNSAMAPEEKDRQAITETLARIRKFSDKVHKGAIHGADGRFKQLLLIGIGGSALGPQFIAQALGNGTQDKLRPYFFDNTDPDGMDRVLASLQGKLGSTLVVVISKSGGTKETRNGMVEAARTYSKAGLKFPQHAIAITKLDSDLDKLAVKERWLDRFPMWDWVGGRTSVTSAVGLLPAALQGIDITQLLEGARVCDEITRGKEIINNPAALLALMWYYSGNGKGEKDMVILPYKDRLELFSRYLQQLIMESLGKELNLKKQRVNQGIAVYGNKGSTDQHAYVQQLRDGINNFFVTFIQVLKDRKGHSLNVESNGTSGDYLHGFLHGTRQALYENGRESITITIREVSPFSVGVLIALYERTVGLYANLIGINAYHQPGVEAGKKAAEAIILLKLKVLNYLVNQFGKACTADQIATALKQPDQVENIFALCEHMAANPQHHINRIAASTPSAIRYQFERHWRRVRDIV